MELHDSIVGVIRDVLRNPSRVSLHEPTFGGREWEYVKDCLDTGWVSSVGKYVDRFEAMLQDLTGATRAVAVVNGTSALQVALLAVGVEPGDEVLMPALTFAGTANAVHHAGAVPHFVEVEERTLGVCATTLGEHLTEIAELSGDRCMNRRTGRRIAALVPVHIFGHPAELDALQAVSDAWRIPLVEDAAESIGSTYHGRHTGTFGRVGVLSFNGNKTVTTGGGGALLTNDGELGARLKHLTTTAKVPHQWRFFHDAAGFNFRMPNINAAVGCAQLEQLESLVLRKRRLAARFQAAFAGFVGARVLAEPAGTHSNYWLSTLLLDEPSPTVRDAVLSASHEAGILLRPAWDPMHHLPMYRDAPRMTLDRTDRLVERIISLPGSAHLELLADSPGKPGELS